MSHQCLTKSQFEVLGAGLKDLVMHDLAGTGARQLRMHVSDMIVRQLLSTPFHAYTGSHEVHQFEKFIVDLAVKAKACRQIESYHPTDEDNVSSTLSMHLAKLTKTYVGSDKRSKTNVLRASFRKLVRPAMRGQRHCEVQGKGPLLEDLRQCVDFGSLLDFASDELDTLALGLSDKVYQDVLKDVIKPMIASYGRELALKVLTYHDGSLKMDKNGRHRQSTATLQVPEVKENERCHVSEAGHLKDVQRLQEAVKALMALPRKIKEKEQQRLLSHVKQSSFKAPMLQMYQEVLRCMFAELDAVLFDVWSHLQPELLAHGLGVVQGLELDNGPEEVPTCGIEATFEKFLEGRGELSKKELECVMNVKEDSQIKDLDKYTFKLEDFVDESGFVKKIQNQLIWPITKTGRTKSLQKSIVLYGPPGTGKSRMFSAIINELGVDADYYVLMAHKFTSVWQGMSGKNLEFLFESIRASGRTSIMFVDELESIMSQRGEKGGEKGGDTLKNLLLSLTAGARDDSSDNLWIVSTTNHPWLVDQAFRSRSSLIFMDAPKSPETLLSIADGAFTEFHDHGISYDKPSVYGYFREASFTKSFSPRDIRKMVAMCINDRNNSVVTGRLLMKFCGDELATVRVVSTDFRLSSRQAANGLVLYEGSFKEFQACPHLIRKLTLPPIKGEDLERVAKSLDILHHSAELLKKLRFFPMPVQD